MSYLGRVGAQVETDLRDIDVTADTLLDGPAGMTISTRAALAQRDGKAWGCVACVLLSWIVQAGHCDKTLDPTSVMPWWAYLRATLAGALVFSGLVALARWGLLALAGLY